MHKFFIILIAAVTMTVSAVDVPPLTGRVVDRAGVFGANGAAQIEQAIMELERATGGQMAVLAIPTLEKTSIEEFGIAVMDKWKIGQKGKDNGAILILAVQDRKMRLEIGYGWEGQINDARAGDVIRAMAPYLRENRYADGVVYAVGAVQKYITGQAPAPPAPPQQQQQSEGNDWGSAIGVLFFIFIFLMLGRRGIFIGGFGGGFGGGRGGFGGGGGFSGGGGRGGGGGASGGW